MKKGYQPILRFISVLVIFALIFGHFGSEKRAAAKNESILTARAGEYGSRSGQISTGPEFLLNLRVIAPTQTQASKPALLPARHPAVALPQGLQAFRQLVADGQPGVIRGVFVEGVLSLPVVQQPPGDWNFVSQEEVIATQFQSAAQNGVTGLLAHNFLAGKLFFDLKRGQKVFIISGDGKLSRYQITTIQRYQKVDSSSTSSDLIDLSSGTRLSAGEVFNRVYTGRDQVTFQTCIEKDGNWTWGLIFIIARPF